MRREHANDGEGHREFPLQTVPQNCSKKNERKVRQKKNKKTIVRCDQTQKLHRTRVIAKAVLSNHWMASVGGVWGQKRKDAIGEKKILLYIFANGSVVD